MMVRLLAEDCWWAIALPLVLGLLLETSGTSPGGQPNDSFRLPKRIKPRHYELLIKPDFKRLNYEGTVGIDFEVVDDPACNSLPRATFGCNKNEIVLHADEKLAVFGISLSTENANATPAGVFDVSRNPTNQFLIVKTTGKLRTGARGRLTLSFRSSFRGNERGFYLNEFIDQDKTEKYYASTTFEAAYARTAFPCFDEPHLKATFELTMEHDCNMTALANMEPVNQELICDSSSSSNDGHDGQSCQANTRTRTRFARTPVMSTYLLAFAVGEFDRLSSETLAGGLVIHLNAPRGMTERGSFALQFATRCYELLLDYFDIQQPLRKIDLLSVKYELGDGAMENWGLVTFQERILLDDGFQTPENKAFSAVAIAHELSHHWFGNLVTMKWWTDLWLNEAFATWHSYEIVEALQAEQQQFHFYYLQDSFMVGLEADALAKTHPVRQNNLGTAEEIQASFDRITYSKGAAVVRMLAEHLGKDQFKLALREYVKRHAFKNTDAQDLWAAVANVTGVSVDAFMESWLDQPGFPLVSVELVGDKIRIKQERFPSENLAANPEVASQRWVVPITVLLVLQNENGDVNEPIEKLIKFELKEPMAEFALPTDLNPNSEGCWLKVNAAAIGFYRVHYSDELLDKLERPIRSKSMSPIDRMNVLDDLAALARSKKVPLGRLDEVLQWFREEDHPGVVYSLAATIGSLCDQEEHGADGGRHLLLLYRYERTNRFEMRPEDGLLESREREKLLSTMIRCNYEPAIREALAVFDRQTERGERVSPVLWASVFLAVAKWGSDDQLARLKLAYEALELGVERTKFKAALKGVDKQTRAKVIGVQHGAASADKGASRAR